MMSVDEGAVVYDIHVLVQQLTECSPVSVEVVEGWTLKASKR